jgi:putative FmdB family regulatory protein
MPVYEYYCRSCDTTFDKLRPIRAADEMAECPAGHPGAARTITVFATLSKGGAAEAMPAGGGCCGGSGCACAAGRN